MNATTRRLFEMLRKRGWQGCIVSIAHLDELREAFHGGHERGLLDETFYREQLSAFRVAPPEALEDARSILIVAVPVPRTRVVFHFRGKPLPVTVPPTYVAYTSRTVRVQAVLRAFLEREGYRLADMALPLKTLAVRSGLATYGRNNIAYVPGMGSFLQLVGACSDLPCPEDSWRELATLERCERCTACLARCPGGAITLERFLLRAERCLTYHNERSADFPAWIDPSWHHCLVGCMRCQEVCPENRAVLDRVEDMGAFTEHETELLVSRAPLERLPLRTADKLRRLKLNEPYPDLCRNLAMLVRQESATA